MTSDKVKHYTARCANDWVNEDDTALRYNCGCLRTSEKLKLILDKFPTPRPPTPDLQRKNNKYETSCVSAYYGMKEKQVSSVGPQTLQEKSLKPLQQTHSAYNASNEVNKYKVVGEGRSWRIIKDMVDLVQLSVTATALVLYYLIYCYMQLVYFTLRSALYFHQADGPMKITIGVVTLTSLIVGFNLLLRMERLIGLFDDSVKNVSEN